MNNSKLAVESISLHNEEKIDKTEFLREREGKLITIIDALQGIASTKEWSSLKEEIFDGLTSSFKKELLSEAKKENPDALKLNRLAGQLKWAEKFSDLKKLEDTFRVELTNVRKILYGKTEKES